MCGAHRDAVGNDFLDRPGTRRNYHRDCTDNRHRHRRHANGLELKMLSFRYRGRVGSWLALVALAFQLAVSFGHVHLEGVARSDSARVASTAGGHASHALLAPQSRTTGGDQDDYCPVCASVYLTANSFVPPAPVLPVPSASNVVEHFSHIAPVFIIFRRLAFQPRAPPLA